MIGGSKRNDVNDAERSTPLWVGKAVLFLPVSLQDAIPDSIANELGTEFSFVQYYQIVTGEEFSIARVDEYLIAFNWGDSTSGKAGKCFAAKEHGLILCDAISGRVQVVPVDVGKTTMANALPRKKNCSKSLRKTSEQLNCSTLTDYVLQVRVYFALRSLNKVMSKLSWESIHLQQRQISKRTVVFCRALWNLICLVQGSSWMNSFCWKLLCSWKENEQCSWKGSHLKVSIPVMRFAVKCTIASNRTVRSPNSIRKRSRNGCLKWQFTNSKMR